jgi:two-component system, chemotaxis family, protein-glutamate methylesterase/glutaminase
MKNTLLIIDDDIDDCLILEESVNQIGTIENIEFKHSIKAGLEFLEENKTNLPKVVVIDVNLPLIDGITGLKAILERYPIKAIVYTTSCTPELKEKALAYGAVDCVQKGNSYADNLKFAKRVFDLIHETVRRPHSVL